MRDKINKRKLLSKAFSGKLACWLNDSLITLRRREELPKVRVYTESRSEQCFTDGFNVFIGLKFPLFRLEHLRGAETTFTAILGVLFHEMGHIMYNHYNAARICHKLISEGTLWPYEPPNMSEKLKDYLSKGDQYRKRIQTYYHILDNCISDARVEHLMLTRHSNYRRFARGLALMRKVQKDSTYELSAWFENEEELPPLIKAELKHQALFSAVVQTGKFGEVKGISDLPKEHADMLDTLLAVDENIADCVTCSSAEEYYSSLNYIFCEIFDDYILPYLETLPEPEECEEICRQIMKSLKEALGESMESAADDSASDADCKAEKEYPKARDVLKEGSSKERADADEEKDEKSETSSAETDEKDSEKKPKEDTSESECKDHDASEETATPAESTITSASSALWSKDEGETIHITGKERESIACTLETISRLEDSGSDKKTIIEALEVPGDLDFGSANAGVDFIIEREPEAFPDESMYRTYDSFIQIGKSTARRLERFLQPVQKSMYERDRYSGTRIVQSKLANPNLRHFAKKNSIPAPPTLSVAILIDESGSMHGNRINSARAAAISLFEMCRALKVRYAVYGHTTKGRSVLMHNYCHFNDNRDSDKYKLLRISAGGENRDGAALRYVADQLHKETSDRKLLIIISDGMPSAPGYGGPSAVADIRSAIKDYEHYEGFSIVAAIIAEPKDAIRAIYGNERSIDIANLNDLPEELIRVVKKVM